MKLIDEEDCLKHMKNHKYQCYKCAYESEDVVEIRRHEKKEHKLFCCDKSSHEGEECNIVGNIKKESKQSEEVRPVQEDIKVKDIFVCQYWGEIAKDIQTLKKHECGPIVTDSKCDECDFTSP